MTDVDSLFRRFEANLRMSPSTVESVRLRYRAITRRLNLDFWEIESETQHSWYAGSYGRGTAISTSDIDILVELSADLQKQYWAATLFGQNGPSQLLQKVKNSLQRTYPTTRLRGDGQVVVVEFSDKTKFEVVPVFNEGCGTFSYPDTHKGGSWPEMRPKAELAAFNDLARARPGGLKKFCRMLRAWNQEFCSVLSGQAIDAMAYEYWQTSKWADESPFLYFDWHIRDFFAYWADEFNRGGVVVAPGTRRCIEISDMGQNVEFFNTLRGIAKEAAECSYESESGSKYWRLIFGDRFPAS